MAHFGDPTWQYHVGMSQLVGITALRPANSDVIPMRYAPYASEVTGYLNDFTQQQKDKFGSVKVDVSRDVHDSLFLDNDVATAKAYETHLYASLQAATRTLTRP